MDVSPILLDLGRQRAQELGLEFKEADPNTVESPQSEFDTVSGLVFVRLWSLSQLFGLLCLSNYR